MNRRDLLKAAIAAPLIAAIPWYIERSTEIRRMTLSFDVATNDDETVVSFMNPDGTVSAYRFRPVPR